MSAGRTNKEIKETFIDLFNQLNNYFTTLAKNEPAKLLARYETYLEIHKMIQDEIMPAANTHKNSRQYASDQLTTLVDSCRELSASFQGKAGRQGYSGILTGLANAIESTGKTLGTAQLLNNALKEFDRDKMAIFENDLLLLRNNLSQGYILEIAHEIKQQGQPYSKKIDINLSNEKLKLAAQLDKTISDWLQTDPNNRPPIQEIAQEVVRVDMEHKALLTGTIGHSKRMGELIETAKNLFKDNFPAIYA